jgi:hypothetical protein
MRKFEENASIGSPLGRKSIEFYGISAADPLYLDCRDGLNAEILNFPEMLRIATV